MKRKNMRGGGLRFSRLLVSVAAVASLGLGAAFVPSALAVEESVGEPQVAVTPASEVDAQSDGAFLPAETAPVVLGPDGYFSEMITETERLPMWWMLVKWNLVGRVDCRMWPPAVLFRLMASIWCWARVRIVRRFVIRVTLLWLIQVRLLRLRLRWVRVRRCCGHLM
ncbi:hypothetical protein BAQU_0068 [Bifidobacterium aquikefiri]|uniref:Uncharacterized protein n=1 Tax=Bifidobacterium aquikefiri TaxID=1653207 RepID=A0A261GBF9_9BIFI|nr:hypothetical protein BAQU_0068 [Bifidobacterium aquikefiri]